MEEKEEGDSLSVRISREGFWRFSDSLVIPCFERRRSDFFLGRYWRLPLEGRASQLITFLFLRIANLNSKGFPETKIFIG